jgi:hypothetical protein
MSQTLDQIRKAIAASEKSRYRLWQETGIDQAQLSRLMAGRDALSFASFERLVEALGRPAKRKTDKAKE